MKCKTLNYNKKGIYQNKFVQYSLGAIVLLVIGLWISNSFFPTYSLINPEQLEQTCRISKDPQEFSRTTVLYCIDDEGEFDTDNLPSDFRYFCGADSNEYKRYEDVKKFLQNKDYIKYVGDNSCQDGSVDKCDESCVLKAFIYQKNEAEEMQKNKENGGTTLEQIVNGK